MDALKASLEKERRPAAPSLAKGDKGGAKKTAVSAKPASKTRKKSASS
jgi:hypothetical protein